ncbi:CBO0543 family protein [Anaerobacillus isosaccharinicus]|uniref:Uncharacterized protein n=1 Tax=Anaerobacillus isosaccharinicus TaxID=1532552 RepID=A0A1S2LDD1_9BACI|nr:CBO0543 family protein [Anaerobacillus isosaccharinicus]MBA5588145.1 hypothetical protein [Anaerobacillus isosaccharinicus]QOY38401.1 hypothetical protein AWH56_013210 [Anaerobacillus isosaccharinicus]
MTNEQIVLFVLWITLPVILYKVIPKSRRREMVAVFLFFQTLTWIFSITLTYFGLLSAPVREFPDATKVNFSLEYIAFPTAAVLFQLWYPENKGKVRRTVHYIVTVAGILFFMLIVGELTELMSVNIDNLIRSFCNFTIELLLVRRYIVWFMKPVSTNTIGVSPS